MFQGPFFYVLSTFYTCLLLPMWGKGEVRGHEPALKWYSTAINTQTQKIKQPTNSLDGQRDKFLLCWQLVKVENKVETTVIGYSQTNTEDEAAKNLCGWLETNTSREHDKKKNFGCQRDSGVVHHKAHE